MSGARIANTIVQLPDIVRMTEFGKKIKVMFGECIASLIGSALTGGKRMPDREKIKAELDGIMDAARAFGYVSFSVILEHCVNILNLLKEQEVVRCKDCAQNGQCSIQFKFADADNPDDWFCADGERKEGR